MRDQVEIQHTCCNCKHSSGPIDHGADGIFYKCSLEDADNDLVRGYESCYGFGNYIPLLDVSALEGTS